MGAGARRGGLDRASAGRRSTAGAALTLLEQVIFYEEYARAGGPGRVGIVGEGLLGPTIIALRHRRAEARASCRRSSRGDRALVPGLLRAERRLRPRQRPDPGRARRRRVGDHRPEGVDVARALGATGASCCAAPTATAPKHKGISYLLVPMDQPGIEIRPIVQITGTSEFNEVFFDGARTAADNVVGEVERRLAGRDGHARVRARRVDARPAARLRERARARSSTSRAANGAARRPGDPPAARRRVDRAARSCGTTRCGRCPRSSTGERHAARRRSTSSSGRTLHRALGELAIDVLGPVAEIADGAPYDLSALQRLFLFTPRRHDLRRLERDPAQRHRRAGARPAARTEGDLMHAPTPRPYPAGRTACSPARPCSSPPPPAPASASRRRSAASRRARGVVISDIHERRLGEAAERARRRGRHAPRSPCNVTVEDAGAGAVRRRGRRDSAASTCW